jgi:predicted small lipoprotein YifL
MTCGLLWLAMVIAGTSACLAGCGQKGPLYLPDEQQQYRN